MRLTLLIIIALTGCAPVVEKGNKEQLNNWLNDSNRIYEIKDWKEKNVFHVKKEKQAEAVTLLENNFFIELTTNQLGELIDTPTNQTTGIPFLVRGVSCQPNHSHFTAYEKDGLIWILNSSLGGSIEQTAKIPVITFLESKLKEVFVTCVMDE